jgi:hypothetical protein
VTLISLVNSTRSFWRHLCISNSANRKTIRTSVPELLD